MAADIVPISLLTAMMWLQNNLFRWTNLGMVLVAIALGSGCGGGDAVSEGEPPAAPEVAEQETPQEEVLGNFRATVIDPPRATTLTTQQAGAQINLRSQPTTLSPIVGNGQLGDAVRLLRLAQGEGGYSWYYVQFTGAETEGWVRGDFVDIASATTAAEAPAEPVAQTVVDVTAAACEGDRQEAFFETKSFAIHVCATSSGLRYLSRNKATQEILDISDVGRNQGTYIAIDGNQQHHISDNSLVIYQVSNGSYSQVKGEPVLRFERFIY